MIILYILLYCPLYLLYLTSSQKQEIIADLRANRYSDTSVFLAFVKASPNQYFRSLLYFRNRNWLSKICRVFYPKEKYFILDIRSEIGGGLRIAHPYATIINAQSMGVNCYINHLVTIGEKNGARPIIGNNVEIHANASIIGGIVIGDNAIIGAGAVVVKDVPANGIAIGNPARIIVK